MSFTAMAWASKQKVNSPIQKLVLLMLANYADDQDKCWPSKQTLADTCCMSKAAVCSNISKLQNAGFLKVEQREGTSSIIRLNTGVLQEDMGCPPRGQGVSTKKTGGVHHVDTNLSMNQSDETITEVYISAQSEFDAFWAAYPKRPNNPRKKAMAAYVKARKNVSQKQLLEAVGLYAAYMTGEDPKFIAMASTWLNDERWNCDYSKTAKVIQSHNDVKYSSDDEIDAIIAKYPGVVSDRAAAKKALASELSKGVALDDIVKAAEKFKLYIKQMQQFSVPMTAPILEAWIKFKWREMDAYYIYRNPVERYPVLKPVKVK